jgi:hypothetical protein
MGTKLSEHEGYKELVAGIRALEAERDALIRDSNAMYHALSTERDALKADLQLARADFKEAETDFNQACVERDALRAELAAVRLRTLRECQAMAEGYRMADKIQALIDTEESK